MAISVQTLHRSLSAQEDMGYAAQNYDRSVGGLVLEVIVGLLTLGVGFFAFEKYHANNRSSKKQECENILIDLLVSSLDKEYKYTGKISIMHKGMELSLEESDSRLVVKYGAEQTVILNKKIDDVIFIIKKCIVLREIVATDSGPGLIEMALGDEADYHGDLARDYLSENTSIPSLRTYEKNALVQAAIDFNGGAKTEEQIEVELKERLVVSSADENTFNPSAQELPVESGSEGGALLNSDAAASQAEHSILAEEKISDADDIKQLVREYLKEVSDKSAGKINKIELLGAAQADSQKFFVNIHWAGNLPPKKAVMQVLRPEEVGRNHNAELVKNIQEFQKLNSALSKKTVRLIDGIASSENYIFFENVAGKSLSTIFSELDEALGGGDVEKLIAAAKTSLQLTSCINDLIKDMTACLVLDSGNFLAGIGEQDIIFSEVLDKSGSLKESKIFSKNILGLSAVNTKQVNSFWKIVKNSIDVNDNNIMLAINELLAAGGVSKLDSGGFGVLAGIKLAAKEKDRVKSIGKVIKVFEDEKLLIDSNIFSVLRSYISLGEVAARVVALNKNSHSLVASKLNHPDLEKRESLNKCMKMLEHKNNKFAYSFDLDYSFFEFVYGNKWGVGFMVGPAAVNKIFHFVLKKIGLA